MGLQSVSVSVSCRNKHRWVPDNGLSSPSPGGGKSEVQAWAGRVPPRPLCWRADTVFPVSTHGHLSVHLWPPLHIRTPVTLD